MSIEGMSPQAAAKALGFKAADAIESMIDLQVEVSAMGWTLVSPGNRDNEGTKRRASVGILGDYPHNTVVFTVQGVFVHLPTDDKPVPADCPGVARMYYSADPKARRGDFWNLFDKAVHTRRRGMGAKRKADLLARQIVHIEKARDRLVSVDLGEQASVLGECLKTLNESEVALRAQAAEGR